MYKADDGINSSLEIIVCSGCHFEEVKYVLIAGLNLQCYTVNLESVSLS